MFRKLLSFEQAQRVIHQQFEPKPLGIEEACLLEASNRVLAEDVKSSLDVPPFDRSTVDGYAVRAESTFGAEENRPIALKICGTVKIGKPPKTRVGRGMAAEIVTGAPAPKGADAIVMVEHTERNGANILVFKAVHKDENVMKAGADIRKSQTVLKEGQLLGSREIGILAAIGLAKVKVYLTPRVAILSTGPEITEPGTRLPPAKIYDINAYSLSTAVSESGGKPIFLGVFPDNLSQLTKALKRALASADMVVTSGGVSVGPKDVMPKALDLVGKPGIVACGIAIKPGKPTVVASAAGKPLFSLPGHPTSALLVFYLFVRPMIQLMAGRKAEENLEVKAFAAMRLFQAKGRRTFVTVRLKYDKSCRVIAEPVPVSISGAITTLASGDGFVEIPENQQFIDADEMVTVRLFKNRTQI